jgi:hypothetical protein
MKTGSERSIEGLKFFPLIAWCVFALFAGFVYLLASELRETTTALQAYSNTADELRAQ